MGDVYRTREEEKNFFYFFFFDDIAVLRSRGALRVWTDFGVARARRFEIISVLRAASCCSFAAL